MKVYADYNLLGRLLEQRAGTTKPSNDPRWGSDYCALEKIYEDFKQERLTLIICKEDGLEEFKEYAPEAIRSYDNIRHHLPSHMIEKFDLFNSLKHGDLLIAPWGDYGFGCGPYGGGSGESYELLRKIRESLGKAAPASSKEDRDARHLMHSVLYRCDYFLTMDYEIIDTLSPLPESLQKYLKDNGYSLNVTNPSSLLAQLQHTASFNVR